MTGSGNGQVEAAVEGAIRRVLAERGRGEVELAPATDLSTGLGLDSHGLVLVVSELIDVFGRDPFAEGLIPDTVGELVEFYQAA